MRTAYSVIHLGHISLAALALTLSFTLQAGADQSPVANAGPDRYIDSNPAVIDGTRSFDPDPGTSLTYQWTQLSGPTLNLQNQNSANLGVQITGTPGVIGTAVLQLIVNDGQSPSQPDTTTLTIVPFSSINTQFDLQNGDELTAFDPNKPTLVYFGGGNCASGSGFFPSTGWTSYANVIDFYQYFSPYQHCGDRLIVYLSSVAPEYDQPIQTAGFSTGGGPAIDAAIWVNTQYHDARYSINQVALLDAACRFYPPYIQAFVNSAVSGEPAWVTNFWSGVGYRSGAVNIYLQGPHDLPQIYYAYSIDPANTTTDLYNHGVVAGAFTSVVQHGKNYRMPNLPDLPYYFRWVQNNPGGQTLGHMEYQDQTNFPGALPEPLVVTGPVEGGSVPLTGATLSCNLSEHTVRYEVQFGTSPSQLQPVFISDVPPNFATGPLTPATTFFWTIRAWDTYGATYTADLRSFNTAVGLLGDFNADGELDVSDCNILHDAVHTSWGNPNFVPAADDDHDRVITCQDAEIWLSHYRAFVQNPTAPDPCGLQDTSDSDADGVRDMCDNCSNLPNPDQADTDHDGTGDLCDTCTDSDLDGYGDHGFSGNVCPLDNCLRILNPAQSNADGDCAGDVCDASPTVPNFSDQDADGLDDICDNCPLVPNPNQRATDPDTDSDGTVDTCDNCVVISNSNQSDVDHDGVGDACDSDNDNDGVANEVDNCPLIANSNQQDDDGDGIGNMCDSCASTAPGSLVDANGCPYPIPGDFDRDGDVDQSDFGHFQVCINGSIAQNNPLCSDANLNNESDDYVNQADFTLFLHCMSGPDFAADPNCAAP